MDISTTQLHTQYFCSTAGAVSSMNMRLPRCIHANAKTLCTRGGVCPASPNCISNDAQDLGLRVGDKCVQQDVPQLHSHLNAIRAGTGSRILRTMCGQIRRRPAMNESPSPSPLVCPSPSPSRSAAPPLCDHKERLRDGCPPPRLHHLLTCSTMDNTKAEMHRRHAGLTLP